VALEALIAELEAESALLAEHRSAVGDAANAALHRQLGSDAAAKLERAVEAMEAAIRRHRLRR
jgi:hypothetical protein